VWYNGKKERRCATPSSVSPRLTAPSPGRSLGD